MIIFKEPQLSDKQWVDELIKDSKVLGCEYTFGNIFCWYEAYKSKLARIKDFMVLQNISDRGVFYSFPIGKGDIYEAIELLRKDATEHGSVLKFFNADPGMIKILNKKYKNEFTAESRRERFDYIYNSENLIELKGKKYHSKRNFINRFKKENTNWCYEDITDENILECRKMYSKWRNLEINQEKDQDNEEKCALKKALYNYNELGLKGGLIRSNEKVIAFTIGEELTKEIFVIHFEKADARTIGAYPIINNEFAKAKLSSYKYINREEDIGEEGLRKSKLSYNPQILLEKSIIMFKD